MRYDMVLRETNEIEGSYTEYEVMPEAVSRFCWWCPICELDRGMEDAAMDGMVENVCGYCDAELEWTDVVECPYCEMDIVVEKAIVHLRSSHD